MSKSAHKPLFLMLLLTVMSLSFIAQLIIGELSSSLTLIPQQVVLGNEWWRLFTHAIALDSPWLAIVGLPVYYWLGRETSALSHDSVFPLGFLIGSFITGLTYSAMPVECPPMGAGLFGMLYSASIAMTIVRSPAITVSALAKLRISIIATLTIGFGFVFLGTSMFSGNLMRMYTYSLESGTGIMTGLLAGLMWSHFRLASKNDEASINQNKAIPTYVPIASQPIRKDERAMINIVIEHQKDIASSSYEEDMDDEMKLNLILEKIHDNQFESLTQDEKTFLEHYSRSMK